MAPTDIDNEAMSLPESKEGELPPAIQGQVGNWIGAQKWDYADVQEWLDHLKLTKYREKFFEWGIDGRILMEMKKEVTKIFLKNPRSRSNIDNPVVTTSTLPREHAHPTQPPAHSTSQETKPSHRTNHVVENNATCHPPHLLLPLTRDPPQPRRPRLSPHPTPLTQDFELLGLLDRKELTKINNSIAKLRATKPDEATYWIPTSQMPKADPKEVESIVSDLGDWVDAIGEMDDALQKEADAEHEVPQ